VPPQGTDQRVTAAEIDLAQLMQVAGVGTAIQQAGKCRGLEAPGGIINQLARCSRLGDHGAWRRQIGKLNARSKGQREAAKMDDAAGTVEARQWVRVNAVVPEPAVNVVGDNYRARSLCPGQESMAACLTHDHTERPLVLGGDQGHGSRAIREEVGADAVVVDWDPQQGGPRAGHQCLGSRIGGRLDGHACIGMQKRVGNNVQGVLASVGQDDLVRIDSKSAGRG
jgi:hypothetical protein